MSMEKRNIVTADRTPKEVVQEAQDPLVKAAEAFVPVKPTEPLKD